MADAMKSVKMTRADGCRILCLLLEYSLLAADGKISVVGRRRRMAVRREQAEAREGRKSAQSFE